VSSIYYWIICCSLAVALVIFFLSPWLSERLFSTPNYANLIKLISIQLPLSNISMLGLVLLRFEKENLKFLIVILTKVVTSLLFVYIFVVFFDFRLNGVFIAQVSSILCSTVLVTIFVRKYFVLRLSRVFSKKNIRYALPQFPARMGSMVLAQANRFFMLGYLTLSAIGVYSVSMKLASSIQLINTAFIMAWAPFMHQQFKNNNNKKVFASVFPLVAAVSFLFVSLISLFSLEMVKLLATKEFYSASKYVGGLSLFFSLYIIKETVDIGPKLLEKTKYLSVTFFLSVVVNIICLYFLIKAEGLAGVVIAMIITNLFLVALSWFVSNRLYRIPFEIFKFVLLIIPVLFISVLPMYITLGLSSRISIATVLIIFYTFMVYFSVKKVKRLKLI